MKSPTFIKQQKKRHTIYFKKSLDVVLDKDNGSIPIDKYPALITIDFIFGCDTYVKSNDIDKESHHAMFFLFMFDTVRYYFARNIRDSDTIYICDKNYNYTRNHFTKTKYTDGLKEKYHMNLLDHLSELL